MPKLSTCRAKCDKVLIMNQKLLLPDTKKSVKFTVHFTLSGFTLYSLLHPFPSPLTPPTNPYPLRRPLRNAPPNLRPHPGCRERPVQPLHFLLPQLSPGMDRRLRPHQQHHPGRNLRRHRLRLPRTLPAPGDAAGTGVFPNPRPAERLPRQPPRPRLSRILLRPPSHHLPTCQGNNIIR